MSYPYEPDYVVPPGATFQEWLAWSHLPLSCSKLYRLDQEWLQKFIQGKVLLNEQNAKKLAAMTFIPSHFWLALEHNYRQGLAAGKKSI